MTCRRRKLLAVLALILLAAGGSAWYWQITAVDRRMRRGKTDAARSAAESGPFTGLGPAGA